MTTDATASADYLAPAKRRDEWAESLSDGTLALGLSQAQSRMIRAYNEVATARGALDRLERETARRHGR